jgi:cell division protein ZapB
MSRLEDLAERVERLLLRHDEQLDSVRADRDSLRARLTAARSRIDALLERLPIEDDASHRSGT